VGAKVLWVTEVDEVVVRLLTWLWGTIGVAVWSIGMWGPLPLYLLCLPVGIVAIVGVTRSAATLILRRAGHGKPVIGGSARQKIAIAWLYLVVSAPMALLFAAERPLLAVVWIAAVILASVYMEHSADRPRSLMTAVVLATGVVITPVAIWVGSHVSVSSPGTGRSASSLDSLPYLSHVPVTDDDREGGVVRFAANASQGLNLLCLRSDPQAVLLDMEGQAVHTWRVPPGQRPWHHVYLLSSGRLLGGAYDGPLTLVDRFSRVLWTRPMRFHHDIEVAPNGELLVLDRVSEIIRWWGLPIPVVNDRLVALSGRGTVRRVFDLYPPFRSHVPSSRLVAAVWAVFDLHLAGVWRDLWDAWRSGRGFQLPADGPFDIMHHNTVSVIRHAVAGVCRPGQVLVSARNMDRIGILDLALGELVWSWGPGVLSQQHKPLQLDDGTILVYDNGRARGASRILAVEPGSDAVVWQYDASPPESFFSAIGGGAQRLANGNTLITEEYRGRVFEVTKQGAMVWEFLAPIDRERGTRAAVYRMHRVTEQPPWLTRPNQSARPESAVGDGEGESDGDS